MKTHFLKTVIVLLNLQGVIQTPISPRDYNCVLPTSCADLLVQGFNKSGIYTVYPKLWFDKSNISVYCDMETDGGGWTVFQRRGKYEVQQSFIQNWNAYRKGFGKLDKEFWLGNDNIYILSNQEYVSLRVDLEDFDGVKKFALYNQFRIAGCQDRYRLKLEQFSGTVSNSMAFHYNKTFVTFDDGDVHTCSERHKGGWWYQKCHQVNINGLYREGSSDSDAVKWYNFNPKSLKKTEMKFRPSYFSFN